MNNSLVYTIDIVMIIVIIYVVVYLNKKDKLSLFNYNVYTKLLLLYIFPIFFVMINIIMNILLRNKPIIYIITSSPILIPIVAIARDCIETSSIKKIHNKYVIQITEEIIRYFRLKGIDLDRGSINLFFDKDNDRMFCKVVIDLSYMKANKLDIKYDIQDILSKKLYFIEFDVLIK